MQVYYSARFCEKIFIVGYTARLTLHARLCSIQVCPSVDISTLWLWPLKLTFQPPDIILEYRPITSVHRLLQWRMLICGLNIDSYMGMVCVRLSFVCSDEC